MDLRQVEIKSAGRGNWLGTESIHRWLGRMGASLTNAMMERKGMQLEMLRWLLSF